ncbi:hypothetical protein M569_01925, partial [Genlisea aurea]
DGIALNLCDTVKNWDCPMSICSKGDASGTEDNRSEADDGSIEFESHEVAYSFYQEYAKSMGFTTSIKNSRRSKKTKEFIDAKFACSRYGTTPEYENSSSRRPGVKKTDCKASMHVKRKRDGKWYIHEFIKEHNHELLPALAYHFHIHRNVKLAEKNNIDILHAVSERTRKMYVEMCRQSGGIYHPFVCKNKFDSRIEGSRCVALDEGDARIVMDHFMQLKKENPHFFYAVELNEEQRVRNLFWIDARNRRDYVSFNDAVFFDTAYIKSNEKIPISLFLGVNHHFQPMLLGCGLLADETKSTFVWLLKTWLGAVGGKSPNVIISGQDKQLTSAIEEIFPSSRHCFPLWHVLERMPETLGNVLRQHSNFMKKFNKCIFKSLPDEEFDMRWWKMVTRFELQENEWVQSLYVDRKKWVPAFMSNVFLAGLSPHHRSESLNSVFDKYVHKKLNLKEFLRQYSTMLRNRYEEEELADFDTCHKQAALKSPSPWEKQMSTIYTHAIFRKFQVEVLGVVGCHSKKEEEDGVTAAFKVDDYEKGENFAVTYNKAKLEVSCSCLMFEYKGFLCRHSMSVLQRCGLSSIPSSYILKRWTKDAKAKQGAAATVEETDRVQGRVQRYNDLCRLAIRLGEEGSFCDKNYNIACRALVEALKNCVEVNNKTAAVDSSNYSSGLRFSEQESLLLHGTSKTNKKNTNKKRKSQQEPPEAVLLEAQDNLEPMGNLSSQDMTLTGYYASQQNVQGLLNLMEPPQDVYYVGQQTMPGMLNSIPSRHHDSFYGGAAHHQCLPPGGHLEFRQTAFPYGP